MLNDKQQRELCYVVTVGKVEPIPGRDRVECAHVGGWTVMVRKGQFREGDPGIYFEVDSRCPEQEPFKFLEKCKYKIKTQKYSLKDEEGNKVGQFWSQGLLMSADDFGWTIDSAQFAGGTAFIVDDKGVQHFADDPKTMFLTEQLGVTYADPEDNVRKRPSKEDKYKKMAQRHPDLFKKKFIRWLYKKEWGKRLLFLFFGKKRDKRGWPAWVKRTDEERVQNMPWVLENKNEFIATEKIDGTSTTFTLHKGKHRWNKNDYYVCSRNVCFDTPEKVDHCFYESNVYLEMSEKYHMENVLEKLLATHPKAEWVTIQGETYGAGIQKRDYSIKDHDLKAFNLIFSDTGRCGTVEMTNILKEYGIPCVPIVDEHFVLPDSIEELLDYVTDKSVVDGKEREGIVFRAPDGSLSFKCVSNEFLLHFHQ